MPHHVVVDGSNLATEGRERPSLRQLNEAVLAYMQEDPDALITVVVDATFGHRIDPKEVGEFDEAVSNNELVAPPAGAIGRGDAFVLSIANKVNAIILTNDSYQEFHAEYPWLFDEGRLVGGKPVPHIGWVFVKRLPVRGPISRKVTSQAKKRPSMVASSAAANLPMPVPTTPPPGPAVAAKRPSRSAPSKGAPSKAAPEAAAPPTSAAPASGRADNGRADNGRADTVKGGPLNELLPFLTFVERNPVGSRVAASVHHYSSHGAYVEIGDVMGYLPLRLMADPAPRSAREFLKLGETVELVVEGFFAEKRSIDLALPAMSTAPEVVPAPAKPRRTTKKAAASESVPVSADAPTPAAAPAKRAAKKAPSAASAPTGSPTGVAGSAPAPAKKVSAKKPVGAVVDPVPVPTEVEQPATAKPATAKPAPAKPAPAKPVAAKPATAKPAAAKPATAKKASAAAPEAEALATDPAVAAPAKRAAAAPKSATTKSATTKSAAPAKSAATTKLAAQKAAPPAAEAAPAAEPAVASKRRGRSAS